MIFPRFSAALFLAATLAASAADKSPLPIAEVQRADPVNFDRDVLPFLNDNCLACHCKTTAKGGLNLETPELMLKGGDTGPGLVPKKSADSLVLQAAAHLDADLAMPPRENKAKAKNLTPEQLGLLKLWIDQGARVFPKIERVVTFQPMAESLAAIFAVAVSEDGQFAACSRENRLSIYHLPSGRCVLNEVAHRDQINALAFHPDGTLLASGGYREVKLWRRTLPAAKLTLPDTGTRAVPSPDGKWLATAGDDGKVKLWSWPEGKTARTLEVSPAAIVALNFSPDSARLACAAADKSLTLWSVADGSALRRAESPVEIAALAWLPDGLHLATGGGDNLVRIWSDALAPGKELKGHTGPVGALAAVAPNRLVSGSVDGTLRIWEIEKDAPVAQIKHGAPVVALAARADGLRFAVSSGDGVVKLWGADGKPVAELRGQRYLRDLAEAKDRALQVETGNVAYFKGVAAATVKLLEGAKERVKKAGEAIAPRQQELEAKRAALPDLQTAKAAAEQTLAVAEAELKKGEDALAAADEGSIKAKATLDALKAATAQDQAAIDQAATLAEARTKEAAAAKADRDQREAARKAAADKLEPVRKAFATAEDALKKAETLRAVADTEVELSKADEQKTTVTLADANAAAEAAEVVRVAAGEALKAAQKVAADAELPIRALAYSADQLTLATAGDDQLVHTWSGETGEAIEVLKGQQSAITGLALTAAGDLVSVTRDRVLMAWNLQPAWKLERAIGTGEAKSPLIDRVNAVAFSHNGKLLATGGGEPSRAGEIKLWDAATGELVRELPNIHSDTVLGLEFSPDDKFLASGAADKMARIVDLATGKIARTLEGHTHHVLSVSWSPDARTLASAGADNMVKVWDVTNGERKKNIEGYDKEVTAVHFASPGANLLTSSGDNKVRLVSVDGKDIRLFSEVADYMQSAAVTANGKVIVAGGQDSILRVWKTDDGAKLGAYGPSSKP